MQIRVAQKVIITNGRGQVLILHRTHTAPMLPDTWDFPGGILEYGEQPAEGAIREVKEETSLTLAKVELLYVDSVVDEQRHEHWIILVYKAATASDTVVLSFEHDDYRWATPAEFNEHRASNQLKRFILEAAKDHKI